MEVWAADRTVGQVWAGVDVGKDECMMVLRWPDSDFSRPIRWANPDEIPSAIECLAALSRLGRQVTVAMESSGTYGDPFRQGLTDAGVAAHRVSGKATKDYAEVFDGVASQHDGKDAAILAELGSIGKGAPWPWRTPSPEDQALRHQVELIDVYQQWLWAWANRIEAWLARHWPEAGRLLALDSVTLLKLLSAYGSPAALAADPEAASRLAGWGGHFLAASKIAAVIASASSTVGVRATEADGERVGLYAKEALAAKREVQWHGRQLARLGEGRPDVKLLAPALGMATACVLHVEAGDPSAYGSGRAYVKALGLNLKERSSGRHKGQLKITKRGSSRARRWLYLAAMRLVGEGGAVSAWYARKVSRDGGLGRPGLVAVMRRVALGVYCCVRDAAAFDPARLFENPRKNKKGRARRGRPGQAAGGGR